jgi:hypothetical protein
LLSTLVAMRLLFILGIVNVVTALALFLSCRCLPTWKIGKNLMKHKWYQNYFRYHCYIWWIFWASVIVHAILAIKYLGWPF